MTEKVGSSVKHQPPPADLKTSTYGSITPPTSWVSEVFLGVLSKKISPRLSSSRSDPTPTPHPRPHPATHTLHPIPCTLNLHPHPEPHTLTSSSRTSLLRRASRCTPSNRYRKCEPVGGCVSSWPDPCSNTLQPARHSEMRSSR